MSHPADRLTTRGLRYGGRLEPRAVARAPTLAEDLALMLEARQPRHGGRVLVGRLQPSPDTWDWAWLDRVVEQTTAAGIDVDLATPTASPPPWLGIAHPETLPATRDGVRVGHGLRNHFCPSSAVYRERCRDTAGRLGERYGSTPGVVMGTSATSTAGVLLRPVRGALPSVAGGALLVPGRAQRRLGDDALESALQRLGRDHAAAARAVPDQPARRSTGVGSAPTTCARSMRSRSRPGRWWGRPITTNYMGFFPLIDYQSWAPDIVADDHYVDPADPSSPARVALTHDLMRSLGHGRWMMMEQSMGAVNWREHNVPKTSRQRRADVLWAVAHGADGVLSFPVAPSAVRIGALSRRAADQRAGGAAASGRARDRCGAGTRVGRGRCAEPARVAVLFDWISRWTADEPSVPSRRFSLLTELERWYRPLWERGVAVDVVPPTADLGRYALVLAPCQHAPRRDGLAALRTRASSRDASSSWGRSARLWTSTDRSLPGPFPGGLFDLLGARVSYARWPLPDAGCGSSPRRSATRRCNCGPSSFSTVTGAEVLARFDHTDLDAAVVRRGSFTYVGARTRRGAVAGARR